MREEILCASEFFSQLLDARNLPTQFVKIFKQRLEEQLFQRFQDHWHIHNPGQGSAYRCIRINSRLTDPVIREAGKATGLSDIAMYLPPEVTMWIDPGEVSFRFGEEGLIYSCSLDSMMWDSMSTPPKQHRDLSSYSRLVTPLSYVYYKPVVPLFGFAHLCESENQ